MKKRSLFISLLGVLVFISNSGHARAAACSDITGYGTVSLTLPVLPAKGTYNIWTRMQVPDDTHNRYRLEINGNACYEIGGSSISPGEWKWVSVQSGDLSKKVRYEFYQTKGNEAQLIGSDAGVKVDRLLLVKNDCIPIELGNNCQSDNVVLSAVQVSRATELPPPSNGPVSGIVIPSTTILQDLSTVAKVIYFADSKAVPTARGFGLDTTLLSNGPHRISIQITKVDGSVVNEATTLVVENKQTIMSPVTRAIRLNTKNVVLFGSLTVVLLIIITAFLITRNMNLKKRLLTFRGF